MLTTVYDRSTLIAIAIGGVLGASLRWLITRPGSTPSGGWFAYAPNTSVTAGTAITGFEAVDTGGLVPAAVGIPVGTLLVNVLGCLALGALTVLLTRTTIVSRRVLVGAATGFSGSLTTFSSFAVDVAVALRGRPVSLPAELAETNLRFERSLASAGVYLVLSLVGGAFAFWLGRTLISRVTS